MAIACSITNSRLLITGSCRPRKHQLGDFFNTNAMLRQLSLRRSLPGLQLVAAIDKLGKNGHTGAYERGSVSALDAGTGPNLWTYATDGWVYSSPAVAYGAVYVGSNNSNVYALNARTGSKRGATRRAAPAFQTDPVPKREKAWWACVLGVNC